MKKLRQSVKQMFGGLLFERDSGRWVLVKTSHLKGKFNIRSGYLLGSIRSGGDMYVRSISTVLAVSTVMKGLQMEHNEDQWCWIHDHLCKHQKNMQEKGTRKEAEELGDK